MIAYCKKDAQSAFAKLAAVLENTAEAEIAGDQPINNADVLNTIKQIIEADPIANPIRTAFEKAWDIAARARDTETERELHTRHAELIADLKAIINGGETDTGTTYRQHLRSHAAWVRAVGKSIGKPAQTALHDTRNAVTDERLERIEKKLDNNAALIEKSQAAAAHAATEAKAANEEIMDARKDFADLGDTICEIVGKERIPPEPKQVDAASRRTLYELAKKITQKRGNLDTFLDKSKWRYRGFTAREIYGDADGLRKFINSERMMIQREKPADN